MTKKYEKAGQPTKYEKRFNQMAYVVCVEGGFTDLKLAKLFSVDKATITNWKHASPKFYDSIRKGKDEFNVAIAENSLLKRVKGGKVRETTREAKIVHLNGVPIMGEDGKIKTELKTTKIVTKQVAPSDKALEFFLKNRDPSRWPNKHDVNVSGDLQIDLVEFCKDDK